MFGLTLTGANVVTNEAGALDAIILQQNHGDIQAGYLMRVIEREKKLAGTTTTGN
jgi:hypothetical protein